MTTRMPGAGCKRALAAGLLAALLPALPAGAQDAIDTAPAMRAAMEWLALVDAGRYGESWERASTRFRDSLAREKWEATVDGIRARLGPVAVRKFRSATYARELPGAPPGEYVVVQYDTLFDGRTALVEVVTPQREPDGRWRVSGYVLR